MRIYLVRHAVAHERDAGRWPDDSERPLTQRGEERFRLAARGMGHAAPLVERLLSSPYKRAWRTAELLAEQTGWPEPEPFPALEPGIPAEKIALALDSLDDSATVALVGHRPSLHELAVYLLTAYTDNARIMIKKGGALRIDFDGPPGPGAGELRWLLTPKVLRAMA